MLSVFLENTAIHGGKFIHKKRLFPWRKAHNKETRQTQLNGEFVHHRDTTIEEQTDSPVKTSQIRSFIKNIGLPSSPVLGKKTSPTSAAPANTSVGVKGGVPGAAGVRKPASSAEPVPIVTRSKAKEIKPGQFDDNACLAAFASALFELYDSSCRSLVYTKCLERRTDGQFVLNFVPVRLSQHMRSPLLLVVPSVTLASVLKSKL